MLGAAYFFGHINEAQKEWKNQGKPKQPRNSSGCGAELGNSPPAKPGSASGAQGCMIEDGNGIGKALKGEFCSLVHHYHSVRAKVAISVSR